MKKKTWSTKTKFNKVNKIIDRLRFISGKNCSINKLKTIT